MALFKELSLWDLRFWVAQRLTAAVNAWLLIRLHDYLLNNRVRL
jgi:hypothetical protein